MDYNETTRTARSALSAAMSATRQRYAQYQHLPIVKPTLEEQTTHSLTGVVNPSLLKFTLLCGLWYLSSAMSSNTGKVIMNNFRYPVTLTFVQFAFVAGYCLLFASPILRFTRLRSPTLKILHNTVPMALFQVGGHIFSSMAISRVPVSTVHTIKALSPLFTVVAYALFFRISYSTRTYFSLLPLTIGVMLACTFDLSSSNFLGLLCAFGSAIVFVSQNIFFKKIMPSPSAGNSTVRIGDSSMHKLDKINLLFYCSGMAFVLMIPLWGFYDLPVLLTQPAQNPNHSSTHNVALYFFFNGTVHFAQNILAFAILQSTSPVTYSIASLIKRVAVIIIAIVWFKQSVHPIQAVGICMTFAGLWLYNQAKGDVEKGERTMRAKKARKDMLLPTTLEEESMMRTSTPDLPRPSQYLSHTHAHNNIIHPIPRTNPFIDVRTSKLTEPSVYPSPPHSPPALSPTATAPSYHPTHVQHRRGTVSSPVPNYAARPPPIAVL